MFLKQFVFDTFVRWAAACKQRLALVMLTDSNPAGWDSARVVEKKLMAYLTSEKLGVGAAVDRIALTADQIAAHGLLAFGDPLSTEDKRRATSGYPFDEQWDLDGLPPDALQGIVAQAIDTYRDKDQWKKALAFEQRERRKL